MKVFRSFEELPLFRRQTVVAIGTFDGLHIGHRRILARVYELARRRGLDSLVLIFYAHAGSELNKHKIRFIQTLSQRLEALAATGVQTVLVVPLDKKVSALSGGEFAETVLKNKLKAKQVVVGENFRFGKDRRCGGLELREFGRKFGFGVQRMPPVKKKARIASSSLIRRLLEEGRVDEARVFLGRPYEIEGRVVRGRSLGKELGFPTANIRTTNDILPSGVFITETRIGRLWRPSLTNIGTNPTFGKNPLGLETFILDYRGQLYGRRLKIRFLKKLREERRFKSREALIERLNDDLGAARRFFDRKRPFPAVPFS